MEGVEDSGSGSDFASAAGVVRKERLVVAASWEVVARAAPGQGEEEPEAGACWEAGEAVEVAVVVALVAGAAEVAVVL